MTTRKYAGLPDLDLAPDVYQTPDLTDDVSTTQETARSASPSSIDHEASQTADSGLVKSCLQPSEARNHFKPMRVDASKANFSDRLDGGRGYYKTSKRHRRRRRYWDGDDDGFFGDLSDDEEESVDRRLARLRHELEEVKMELADKKASAESELDSHKKPGQEPDEDILANVSKLSQALDAVYTERNGGSKSAQVELAQTIYKFNDATTTSKQTNGVPASEPAYSKPSANTAELLQALGKAAEFDGRLTFLEHSLGLNGMNMPEEGPASPKPILRALETLDRQVQTVSNSSASIDAAQSKTRQLIKDVERLQKLKAAQEEQTASPPPSVGTVTNGNGSSYTDDPERSSKINALYGTLSTIDSLAPTLPMVLDRLRTLRLLHTSAAGASNTLDQLEKGQSNQAAEIKQWREALEQVEQNLRIGEGGLQENVKIVEDWVKDLESRMAKFS
ncbi:hypothetical protein EJ08DRAFT_644853 [Tothia fuscella]|uniref:Dynactin subunit 2 n=1 Tax=Tothia fuscella TaxID=1048955 RepID=A0A9P4P4D2_9PEZI|nr:hypothetical protein EJ08DRAFT_644853 [Tothia fuscella]